MQVSGLEAAAAKRQILESCGPSSHKQLPKSNPGTSSHCCHRHKRPGLRSSLAEIWGFHQRRWYVVAGSASTRVLGRLVGETGSAGPVAAFPGAWWFILQVKPQGTTLYPQETHGSLDGWCFKAGQTHERMDDVVVLFHHCIRHS